MIAERKMFVIQCDICWKNEIFYARSANDQVFWPSGWVVRQDEGVGGLPKDYHYCPECKETISQAGS